MKDTHSRSVNKVTNLHLHLNFTQVLLQMKSLTQWVLLTKKIIGFEVSKVVL